MTRKEQRYISSEKQREGFRLACQTKIHADMTVEVQNTDSGGVIMESGRSFLVSCRPNVRQYEVELAPPTLEDFRDDCQRLFDGLRERDAALKELEIDHAVLKKLPGTLRKGKWHVSVAVLGGKTVVDVRAEPLEGVYGVSIDLGTTTLAASLSNLQNGRLLGRTSRMNTQIRYGDDVLSRVSYTMTQEDGLSVLSDAIRKDIQEMMKELAQDAGISLQDIFEVVIVGNTVMEHIFLGLDPQYIGKAPFISVLRKAVDIRADLAGLSIAPSGNVHFLPIEAGFVGADNVAVILAVRPHVQDKNVLVIDIGTNGEIVLGNRNRLLSTSCATGPALEGAQILCGMRAAPGAIEKVKIDPATGMPECRVIGNMKPKGICGSGIIDVIAEMLRAGILRSDGSFDRDVGFSRVRQVGPRSAEYILASSEETGGCGEIVITQKDVRAVQLAKGAIYAGARILMGKLGIEAPERIVLAGAFGSYIDVRNALYIGMFPEVPVHAIESAGNAAGEGARMALLDKECRMEAQEIARHVEFVEVANESSFQRIFFDGMMFHNGKSYKDKRSIS